MIKSFPRVVGWIWLCQTNLLLKTDWKTIIIRVYSNRNFLSKENALGRLPMIMKDLMTF